MKDCPRLLLRAKGKGVFEKVLNNRLLRDVAKVLSPGQTLRVTGVWGSSAALAAAAIGRIANAPVLLIAKHLDDADELADDIEVFTGSRVHLLPAWEVDIGTEHINDEVAGERLHLCNLLAHPPETRPEQVEFIVAPVMSLLQPVPSRQVLSESRLMLSKGGRMELEALCEWLVDSGFEHVEQVDQQGEFATRGGIADIFPTGAGQALRVEFFGDEISSLRLFDLDTQRSTDEIESYDISAIAVGREIDPARTDNFLSYLPAETIICMYEPGELADLAGELHQRITDSLGGDALGSTFEPDTIFAAMGDFAVVEMYTFAGGKKTTIDLGVRSLERLTVNTHEALRELTELSEAAEVWVYCENPTEQQRFKDLIITHHPKLAAKVNLSLGHVNSGFYWPDQRLVAVGHHELYRRYAKVRRISRARAGRPIESLLDLSDGDYVVHVAHGIAKFDGLCSLESDGRTQEDLSLKFSDNATLHVPANQIDLVQKYIGARQRHPTLSTLGGGNWARTKSRVAEAVKDMAAEMLRIQAMRQSLPSITYPLETDLQRQFVDEFLYTETEDQLSASRDINEDMATDQPMDRLLCGDVGFGKTEMAMRAAFKVAEAGRQVAVLVPTTVLASQHYRTFSERFADYPINIDVLSRFRTAKQQADVIKRLSLGQVDILIGTHRILSKDVRFGDLGWVIIDEEQRFGVDHKEGLKKMRATVEVLTMTATPIPRTLHMALLGLRDISSLTTPPMDRRSIHTEVCHYDTELIRKAIYRELSRGGQVFFVHNRVGSIRLIADTLGKLVPQAKLAIGHGQMPEGELEKTMLSFVRGDIDVLVCTTIIESGLDIPTANTIIINNADRFGLSELHQLRGRVGRYKHRAYCYLLLPQDRPVSHIAAKRLKAIEEFSDLGAGFQIAMRDLEIRGAGNILGRRQSGHIATVGYELYCQLLEQAVSHLQGKTPKLRRDAHVELGADVYIPRWYIPADRQRMEIYRRLVKCSEPQDLHQLSSDLVDAYGKLPPLVQTLLDIAEIRVLAGQVGVESILLMEPDIIFTFRDFQASGDLLKDAAGSVRLPDDKTVHWRPPKAYLEMPSLITILLRRLRRATEQL